MVSYFKNADKSPKSEKSILEVNKYYRYERSANFDAKDRLEQVRHRIPFPFTSSLHKPLETWEEQAYRENKQIDVDITYLNSRMRDLGGFERKGTLEFLKQEIAMIRAHADAFTQQILIGEATAKNTALRRLKDVAADLKWIRHRLDNYLRQSQEEWNINSLVNQCITSLRSQAGKGGDLEIATSRGCVRVSAQQFEEVMRRIRSSADIFLEQASGYLDTDHTHRNRRKIALNSLRYITLKLQEIRIHHIHNASSCNKELLASHAQK